MPQALKELSAVQSSEPKVEKDLRKVLDDPSITALVVAAPDNWHALATVWACQAGKHVYCEKPASFNLVEGRPMVEAARKHNRVVQIGTQARSGPHFQSAAEFIRSGKLGKTPMAKTWIGGARKSIGHKKDGPTPTRRRLQSLDRTGPIAALQPEPVPLRVALELGPRHRRDRQ